MNYRNIELQLNNKVYWPNDDTDLITKTIINFYEKHKFIFKKNNKREFKILEIGCGPGSVIISIFQELIEYSFIKKNVLSGLAIDIDKEATKLADKNVIINGFENLITIIQGDLFQPLKEYPKYKDNLYDMIIFNPPYLPSELETINHSNRQSIDKTWEGGKKGYELTLRFLEDLGNFLSKVGVCFIISSTQVNQEKIINSINTNDFQIKDINKKHVFFEDILCYIIQHKK